MEFLLALWLLFMVDLEAMDGGSSIPPGGGEVHVMDGGSSIPPGP